MKTTSNTYSLLVHSEEKGRTIFEGLIIGAIVLCTAFTGWQFATSSVILPGMAATSKPSPAPMIAKVTPEQPIVTADRG